MAKKSKTRGNKTSSKRRQDQQVKQDQARRRQRMLLGGLALVLVIGAVVVVRYIQRRSIQTQLQGAIDDHYTRGVEGAPVVVKEFSDYA